MWLFTKYGFYSATRSKTEPEKMQIRARARQDLVNLQTAFHLEGEILVTPKNDYRYRIIVSMERWVKLASELAADIDYNNFKAQIKDYDRHDLYVDIWATMLKVQETEERR
jgi:hypothetical protein